MYKKETLSKSTLPCKDTCLNHEWRV